MLELKVQDRDREVVLKFEHSLLSLSKWESVHKRAFLSVKVKPSSDMIDYFQCMLVSPEDTEQVYRLNPDQLDQLANYINEPQTASSIPQDGGKPSRETVTSELIYSWMTMLRIPFHPAEEWHLSRLMMLIQIVNYKSQPEKKQNKADVLRKWQEQQAMLKERYGTTG